MHADKVIVTNVAALRAKYGNKYAGVKQAVTLLMQADAARGLSTKLIAIDSATDMRRVKGRPVAKPSNQQQVKAAIDAIYAAYTPDYILILGAPDVVPHVVHANPTQDDDEGVASDLAYACAHPWSRNSRDFLGPTRVIGRLPDIVGATDPAYLVKVLGIATRYKMRDRASYAQYLGISAQVWQKSTQLSLENLFGEGAVLFTSPTSGPAWPSTQLAKRTHFINCHGAPSDPTFYGQQGNQYPKAHEAARLKGKITEGAVIAAECCYGGELYNPTDSAGQAGICSTYLAQGAYGVFASATIAYGPAEGNGQADLICQYFIDAVIKGASLGRAALEARQRFAAQYSHLDPVDLKTLLQFNLLGDPSIHPVKATPHALSRSKAMLTAQRTGVLHPEARAFRRERLTRTGSNLSQTLGTVVPAQLRTPPSVQKLLIKAARESGLRRPTMKTYRVAFPPASKSVPMRAFSAERRERCIYMVIGKQAGAPATGPIVTTAIIATVQAGKVVHVRRVHSR